MLLQAIALILIAVVELFVLVALLRFWMQTFRAPSRNPIAQFSMALTDFAVRPLRRVVPPVGQLDAASVLVALVFEFALQAVVTVMLGTSPFDYPELLPWVFFLALVRLARLSIYIFMGAIIIQAVLSWVHAYHPVTPFFEALGRPFLRPVRKLVPLVGGVDISPVFVLIFFQVLVSLPVAYLENTALHTLGRIAL